MNVITKILASISVVLIANIAVAASKVSQGDEFLSIKTVYQKSLPLECRATKEQIVGKFDDGTVKELYKTIRLRGIRMGYPLSSIDSPQVRENGIKDASIAVTNSCLFPIIDKYINGTATDEEEEQLFFEMIRGILAARLV